MESLKKIMDELDALNRCLHEQAEGAVGGPLHIVTDDGNLSDSDVCYCWGDSERASDVVVRVLCLEILRRLVALTEPQRLVWWLRRRIQALGIDDATLAVEVRDGVVDPQENGVYDARIKLGDKLVWAGLEQLEAIRDRGNK